MKAHELIDEIERRLGVEVRRPATGSHRSPREIVSTLELLDPRDRSIDEGLVCEEIAAALGRPGLPPNAPLGPQLTGANASRLWDELPGRLGVDSWPRLEPRPALAARHVLFMALFPIGIFVITQIVTGVTFIAALATLMVALWMIAFAANRMKETQLDTVPPGLTLSDLAHRVATRRAELAALPRETFDRDRLVALVRLIAADRGVQAADFDLDRAFESANPQPD